MSRHMKSDKGLSARKRRACLRVVGSVNPIERLEHRLLLSTTTIDHSPVSATVGGFPAGGTDLTLNSTSAIGATTSNTPPITNVLQLTEHVTNNQATSAFAQVVQGVDSFHTTFDFTYGNGYTGFTYQGITYIAPGADGFMFVLQNDQEADTALRGGGSDLAYRGMTNSVGIKFDLWDNDDQPNGGPLFFYSATGVYVNGDFPGDVPRISPSSAPVRINPSYEPTIDLTKNPDGSASGMDFHANPNDVYHVDLNYDGTTLTETVADTSKNITETQAYLIDIPFYVGGHTAYAGFTGATGTYTAEQDIIDWKYTGTANSGGLALPPPNVGAGSDCTAGTALVNFSEFSGASASGFEIDSATGGGAFSKLADVPATATSYTASGLDPTQTYHYKVKALGDGTNTSDSPFSDIVSVTPAGSQPIDFSGGFPSSSALQLNGSARLTGPAPSNPPNVTIPPNALEITANTRTRAGSVFATSEQMISKFDTTFDFVYPEVSPQGAAEGFTFIIQKDPSGLVALGDDQGGLGYSSLTNSMTSPITKSVVIKFDLNDFIEGFSGDSTGLFINGDDPRGTPVAPEETIDMTPSGVVLPNLSFNGDKYHVHLSYDGKTLHEEVDDVTAGKTFTHDYTIDIPSILGDTCGWVGFTGSTGPLFQNWMAQQVVTKWTFTGAGGAGPKDVINDPIGGNTITLKQDATNHAQIDWTMGAQSGNLPITDAKGLTINDTGAAVDTIVFDPSNGNPYPNLLKLNGKFATSTFQSPAAAQTIDLESSTLTINYSGSTILPAVQKLLASGYDAGKWDGSGIISSTAASNSKFGIADVDSGSAVTLSYALKGDASLNGKVAFEDLVALARNYGKSGADWSKGDFDYNGKVDFADLVILARNYGASAAVAGAAPAQLTAEAVNSAASLADRLQKRRRH